MQGNTLLDTKKKVWWRRRESNPTSVLKTLNLLILGMPALQEMQ